MKSPHFLYELIQSLQPSEKSYFKKFTTLDGNKDKAYIKLFDILNELPNYDEEIVLRKLKKLEIKASLPKLKDYLYEILLDSLVYYHKSSNNEIHLYNKYQKNLILATKGLYDQSKNYSYELKEEALSKQNNIVKILSDFIIVYSLSNLSNLDELKDYIEQYKLQSEEDLKQLQNEFTTQLFILNNVYYSTKYNHGINLEEIEEFKKLIQPIMEMATPFRFPKQEVIFLNECAVFYSHTKKQSKVYQYHKMIFDTMTKSDQLILDNINNYLISYSGMSNRTLVNRFFDQYEYVCEVFNETIKRFDKYLVGVVKQNYEYIYYANGLKYFSYTGQLDKLIPLLNTSIEWCSNTKNLNYYLKNKMIEQHITLLYQTKQYKRAVDLIWEWLQDGDKNNTRDKVSAWIYLLVIHFEEKNFEVVKSLIVPSLKFFRKCKMSNDYVAFFIDLFKKINNNSTLLDNPTFLHSLINDVPKDYYTYRRIGTFNQLVWLKSRLYKISYFEELLKLQNSYCYPLLDQFLEEDVPLYDTPFLRDYKLHKTTAAQYYIKN